MSRAVLVLYMSEPGFGRSRAFKVLKVFKVLNDLKVPNDLKVVKVFKVIKVIKVLNKKNIMIDKIALIEFVNKELDGTEYFLVDVTVSAANDIVVEIDSPERVDIDFCCDLSRAIEEAFPRDDEDYSLEVGSAGLTSPFKVLGQYIKNIGQKVEVLTADGRKLKGMLDDADSEGFTIGVETKVKEEGMKRPEWRTIPEHFTYDQVKKVNALLEF